MKDFIDKLIDSGIEKSEAIREVQILFEEFKNNHDKIKEFVKERAETRKPLQYLLGESYFLDFKVKVNENVLIPRPETEILVLETKDRINKIFQNKKIKILEIGTGSGIIPIALAKSIKDIEIISIDISKKALELAFLNAKDLNIENKIKFKQCDIFTKCFEGLISTNNFDVVISNPPYVKNFNELELMFEPEIALCGNVENTDGLSYYKRILELFLPLKTRLIALEIDSPLADSLINLVKVKSNSKLEIIKDYAGFDRCLFIYN